jgi:uncharacterized protein with HEPN domain
METEVNTISKYTYVYEQRNKLEYILNYEHKIVEYTADMRHDKFKVTQFVVSDISVQIHCTGDSVLRSSNRYEWRLRW